MSSASTSSAEPVGPRSQSPRRKVAFVSPLGVDDDAADGASVEEHVPISQDTDDGESCMESDSQDDVDARFTRATATGRSILDTISSLWHSEGFLLHKLEEAWDQGNGFTRGSMIGV